MKNVVKKALMGVAVLAVVAGLSAPAMAQCADSVLFGNRELLSAFPLNVDDPTASWATYMYQDPTINQGPVTFRDLLASFNVADPVDFGDTRFEPRTAAILFGDWAGAYGAGFDVLMRGCPLDLDATARGGNGNGILDDESLVSRAQEVFIFSDSKGTTIFVTDSTRGNFFNLDEASADLLAARSTLKPEITLATLGSSVSVNLQWQPPTVNFTLNSPAAQSIAGQLVRGYQIFERRYRTASATDTCPNENLISDASVPDADGISTDTRATVILTQEANVCSTLSVAANLGSSGTSTGASVRGTASSAILLTPGLATSGPGKGKGKGLDKAPGQSR